MYRSYCEISRVTHGANKQRWARADHSWPSERSTIPSTLQPFWTEFVSQRNVYNCKLALSVRCSLEDQWDYKVLFSSFCFCVAHDKKIGILFLHNIGYQRTMEWCRNIYCSIMLTECYVSIHAKPLLDFGDCEVRFLSASVHWQLNLLTLLVSDVRSLW